MKINRCLFRTGKDKLLGDACLEEKGCWRAKISKVVLVLGEVENN